MELILGLSKAPRAEIMVGPKVGMRLGLWRGGKAGSQVEGKPGLDWR